jgi:hypothetical protein
MPPFRLVVAPLLVLTLLIAACGGGPAGTQTPVTTSQPTQAAEPTDDGSDPGPAEPDATPGTALNACELVAPDDIEAALDLDAGTVEEGELTEEPTVLDPNRQECRYNADWGGLVVDLTPTDGLNTYDAVADTFGEDAESIDGIGEGALWFEDNNRGYFLQGSVMVLLQFTHLVDSDLDSFRDPTVALGEAAVNKI